MCAQLAHHKISEIRGVKIFSTNMKVWYQVAAWKKTASGKNVASRLVEYALHHYYIWQHYRKVSMIHPQ